MNSNFRSSGAAQRFADRRAREDAAPRLKDEVPRLSTLKMEVSEVRGESVLGETSHVRHVIVDRAPALFFLPCGDSSCRDGGHDVTTPVLHALRAGATRFEGEDACHGTIGSSNCARVVRYVLHATYSD